jgi:hypothetical protein
MGPLSTALEYSQKAFRITTENSESGTNAPLEVSLASSSTAPLQTVSAGYSFLHLNALASTLVKTGAGVLHSLTINNIGATATVTVYDGTSTSGTEIAALGGTLGFGNVLYDAKFATGLYIVIAGTTSPDITLTYE